MHGFGMNFKINVNHIDMKKVNIKSVENVEYIGREFYVDIEEENNQKSNIILKILTGAFIGFVNGFWGGGGGMICVPMLMYVLKLPEKNAHATTLLIMLPLSIASLIIYLINGHIEWMNALNIGVGFVIGGVLGALILKKISNVWLGIIFSVIIIAGGIKLLL